MPFNCLSGDINEERELRVEVSRLSQPINLKRQIYS